MRNGGDAQQVGIGWWPGDPNHERAAFFALAYPAPDAFADADLSPSSARWDAQLGEYVLEWEDIRESPDPHALALEFAPVRIPPRLRGVRVGPRSRGHGRGCSAADQVR